MDSALFPNVLWHIIKQYMAYCEECRIYIDKVRKYFTQNQFGYIYLQNVLITYDNDNDLMRFVVPPVYRYSQTIDKFTCNVIHNQPFLFEMKHDLIFTLTYEDHLRGKDVDIPFELVNGFNFKSHQEARLILRHLIKNYN